MQSAWPKVRFDIRLNPATNVWPGSRFRHALAPVLFIKPMLKVEHGSKVITGSMASIARPATLERGDISERGCSGDV
jgi:hypothetical protein